jgi:hypothetical protein
MKPLQTNAHNLAHRIKRRLALFLRPLLDAHKSRAPFFRQFPAGGAVSLVNSRTLIDTKHKFVYSRVPKAANSSVVATLYLEDDIKSLPASVEHLKCRDKRLVDLSRHEVERIEAEYCKFTFVRNPYTRLASCYLDKFKRPHPVGDRARRLMGLKGSAEVGFDQFLDFLETDRGRLLDAHWARQIELMAFPLAKYDFIGSVENIEQDLPRLLDLLHISKKPRRFSPHRTPSKDFLQNCTPSQLRRILNIYQPDFLAFSYSFDPQRYSRDTCTR